MNNCVIRICETNVRMITLNTAIVGSGAAGYNAALSLKRLGIDDIAVITEHINCGTSRNTGSDKQTYYKLDICGGKADSPYLMAQDIFNGKCVDGDNALAEAENSLYCFFRLCELGVPFPTDRFGGFIGYKTDHDNSKRATSAGPLTSKMMTECLQSAVEKENIPVLDKLLVIDIIKKQRRAVGLVCLNTESTGKNDRFCVISAGNIIFATGGPAGIYENTVYPNGHHGSSGVLFSSGAAGQNLTEWQYGLASIKPRWNVSGTYMQVLPNFISIDEQGKVHEFLAEYYSDEYDAMSAVFRKGYEWPFDSRKAKNGSSVIDLLVYRETVLRKRRVYLDFTRNPFGINKIDFHRLSEDAYEYLNSCGACFGTPIERLLHMNSPAVELYTSKGVDIKTQYLEIAVCAQHCNGGASVDEWWRSGLDGLFVAGEAAGTHGVYRPGGSALNSGQVGSLRAAQYISQCGYENLNDTLFVSAASKYISKHIQLCEEARHGKDYAKELTHQLQSEMSAYAGAIRNASKFDEMIEKRRKILENFTESVKIESEKDVKAAYLLRDIATAQLFFISAMSEYLKHGGKSRGSAIYTDETDVFDFTTDNGERDGVIEQLYCEGNDIYCTERPVRPIPNETDSFENVWRGYRENKNIY